MRALKTVLDFYINSSIHVALAVYALSWITLLQFDIDYDGNVLYFSFFASITGYNFVKFFGLAKFHHRKLTSMLKSIQMLSLISFIAMGYYLLQLQMITIGYIAVFALATFLYAVPVLPKRLFIDQQKNLRSIGGLKIYIIALVWTGVTVVLPLIDNNHDITKDVFITGVQRFFIVIVLMLPFEIRDLNFDSLKLSTIPQKIGVKGTKVCGVLLLLVSYILEFLRVNTYPYILLSHTLIILILCAFLLLSFKRQSKYYTAFWVESIPIWWLILLLVLL